MRRNGTNEIWSGLFHVIDPKECSIDRTRTALMISSSVDALKYNVLASSLKLAFSSMICPQKQYHDIIPFMPLILATGSQTQPNTKPLYE